jgi:hypothetical protein
VENPADAVREQTSVQRSVTATVAVPECMQDTSAPKSPESFCGQHGICTGPRGCKCDSHWYGVRCNAESETLVAPDFVWRGWTVLIIILILGAGARVRHTIRFASQSTTTVCTDQPFVCSLGTAVAGCCGFVWFGAPPTLRFPAHRTFSLHTCRRCFQRAPWHARTFL